MACFSSYSFCILVFYAEEVAPHVTVIPILQHRGFYFPPAANKDRAVNSMEIKDFIILWTYSQWRQAIVVIPPLSPEREKSCILPLISFYMLAFYKREYSALPLQSARIAQSRESNLDSCRPMSLGSYRLESRRDLQTANKVCDLYPFSPEREICDILLLSFIQTKWNQLSTIRQQRPGCQ